MAFKTKRQDKNKKVRFDLDIEDGNIYSWYVPRVTSTTAMEASRARLVFANDITNRDSIAASVLGSSIVKSLEPIDNTPPFVDLMERIASDWDIDEVIAEVVRLATTDLVTLAQEGHQVVKDEPEQNTNSES